MLCAQEVVVGVTPPEHSSKVKPPIGEQDGSPVVNGCTALPGDHVANGLHLEVVTCPHTLSWDPSLLTRNRGPSSP